MKHFILAAFLLLACRATAQNYKPLQPGQMPFFTNGNHYLRGMRIDSVRTMGTDTLYYPYHTARGAYGCTSGSATLDSSGGSWWGKKIIQRPNGDFLFDNIWNDTICIKTQAHPGDSWTFLNYSSYIYYTAVVTGVDTMTVLGSLDSIKRITIQADSGGMVYAADPVNYFELLLSKEHGFVQAFDLYTFPYHRPDTIAERRDFIDYYLDLVLDNLGTADVSCFKFFTNAPTTINSIFRRVPLYDPTGMDIYDFNVGDVFETYEQIGSASSAHYETIINTIVAKIFNPHTIDYRAARKRKTVDAGPGTYIEHFYYDTTSFAIADTSHFFYFSTRKLPEEWRSGEFYHYDPSGKVIEAYSSDSCVTAVYTFNLDNIDYNTRKVVFEPTDMNLEIGYSNTSYGIGYGEVSHHSANYSFGSGDDKSYLYVNKGGIHCGFYQPVAVKDVAISATDVTIFPNPASLQITISATQAITSIAIYDAVGQLRQEVKPYDKSASIDVSLLPPGIYLVRINNSIVKRFSKQ